MVFVPFSAPGDRLRVTVTNIHKNYVEARIDEVLTKSEARREPLCPVFGTCGGCRLQHILYEEQLRQKEEFLRFYLKDVLASDAEIKIVAAPAEYRYRNRIQLHKKGDSVGYFAEGTHNLVAINDCPIANEQVRDGIRELEKNAADGKYELVFQSAGPTIKNLSKETIEFSQVNTAQNVNLKQEVMLGLIDHEFRYIYDLYCGSGNFSFQLARAFPKAQIVGVEANDLAIGRALEAYQQLKSQKLANMHFYSDDVAKFIKNVEPTPSAMVLVNPPRAGLQNSVLQHILRLKPNKLVYVSCNLATLARDLTKLAVQYKVDRVSAVDMFPQTEYIETVVHLSPA